LNIQESRSGEPISLKREWSRGKPCSNTNARASAQNSLKAHPSENAQD